MTELKYCNYCQVCKGHRKDSDQSNDTVALLDTDAITPADFGAGMTSRWDDFEDNDEPVYE